MRSKRSKTRLEARFVDFRAIARPVIFWVFASLGVISSSAQPGSGIWTNYYDGTGHGEDMGYAVCVDGSNNVYVTGLSVGSAGHGEYATVAYASSGAFLWANRYSKGFGDDEPRTVVSGFSNVYVIGYSSDVTSPSDYTTLAYSDGGIPLWTNFYSGPGTGLDWPRSAAWDSHNGNLYITGMSQVPINDNDYVTIAYASSGATLWINRFGSASYDVATAVAVGQGGVVFVTGTYDSRCATVAYSDSGACLWTNYYSSGGLTDEGDALAVDKGGNVYVGGSSLSDTGYDWFVVAYTSAGVALWTNRYDGPSSGDDFVSAIAVDNNGHVYVSGISAGMTSPDYLTIGYSSFGVGLWTNRYDGPGSELDEVYGMAVDRNGNVYVTGTSFGNNQLDFATIGYSSAGVGLWTNRFNRTAVGDDAGASSITVDNDGNVLVTGYSTGPDGTWDIATIKYAGQTQSQAPIPIEIQRLSNGVRLSWSNAAFTLQSAPSLNGTFTNVAGAASPYTNAFTGSQQFFRLKLNTSASSP